MTKGQSYPLLRKLALVVLVMFGFAFALVPFMTSSAGSPGLSGKDV